MSTVAPRHAPRAWLGMTLGVAMGLANVLGYLGVLLLSRTLGPADFGGYSALTTYGLLFAIPAGALQVVIARRMSMPAGHGGPRTSGLVSALVIGTVAWAVTAALAPLLSGSFHLASTWSPVVLGAFLVPMTVTGCFQGVLLGTHRVGALSTLYIATAVFRLAAAVVARLWDLDVLGVLVAMLLAAIATAAVGWWLCRPQLRSLAGHGSGLVREMLRSNSTLAAYIALTNVDMLLARHFLTPHDSGGYALASTFGRAVGWGTQFVALLIVPRMARHNATRTLLRASGLVLAIGLVGFAIVAAAPKLWITVAGGAQFTSFAHLSLACVVMGIGWALAQVWLFSEMGHDRGVLGALTWGVVVAEIVAIWAVWHQTATQIVAVCTAGAVLVALAGFVLTWLRHQAGVQVDETSAVAAASADHA